MHEDAYMAFYLENHISPPSALMSELTDTYYFAKNKDLQFIYANKLLSERFNLPTAEHVFLKTDFDFFRPDIAEQIRQDDLTVIRTQQPIHRKLEIVNGGNDEVLWLFTTKSPLFNIHGDIVGIEGVSIDATKTRTNLEPYHVFKECIDVIQKQYMRPLKVSELAALSNMSLSTFERRFKKYLGTSPAQYIKNVRVQEACFMLREGHSIQDVAYSTGFCDQSYFSKEFKRLMNTTPKAYRNSFLTTQTKHV